jgi:redox-regulated HSP33 family molecular chaperone
MKQQFDQIVKQGLSIIVTALLAALIAFLQALTAQLDGGGCVQEVTTDAGLLGAVLKSAHSTFALMKRTPFV